MAKKQKKPKKQDDGPPGAPAWMMTYGDMVTLVLTFFVLLVSMMVIDPKKFVEFLGTYQQTFGEGHDRPTEDDPVKTEDFFTQIIKVSSRTEDFDGGQQETMEGEAIRVHSFKENYVVTMTEKPFFSMYEIMLTPDVQQTLDMVAMNMRKLNTSNRVRIIGHYSRSEASFDIAQWVEDSESARHAKGIFRNREHFDEGQQRLVTDTVFLNDPQDIALYRARAVREYLLYALRDSQFTRDNFQVTAGGPVQRDVPLLREGEAVRVRESTIGLGDDGSLGGLIDSRDSRAVIPRGGAETQLNAPVLKQGLSLRSWPSFIFTEGGKDFGRTAEIIVTGEIIGESRDPFMLPSLGDRRASTND